MPRLHELRVIIDPEPRSGVWNMAVDEVLLESAISSGIATLRWYQWEQPTISLGYFQKAGDLNADPQLSHLPVVRRLTGGGAILHDNELTYSVSLPASQTLFTQPHELYDIIHQAIASELQQAGIPAKARGSTLRKPVEPLLCFQREDAHDVVLNGRKILGSAQRRRRGAIMEHGSLLKQASLVAEIPGIRDLCQVDLPDDLTQRLAQSVANTIAETWKFESLTKAESILAETLMLETYQKADNR